MCTSVARTDPKLPPSSSTNLAGVSSSAAAHIRRFAQRVYSIKSRASSGVIGDTHLGGCERPFVGELRDPFVGWPVAVGRLRLDANQNRPIAPLGGLHHGSELER